MADEREAVENAYPGDIIGLFDPGIFAPGRFALHGQKRAAIRAFRCSRRSSSARVSSIDESIKRKQFVKGVFQLERGRRDSDLQAAGHRL